MIMRDDEFDEFPITAVIANGRIMIVRVENPGGIR